MELYLTTITTVLVITQIIRVVQNAIQLKRYARTQEQNNRVEQVFKKLDKVLDEYLERE